MRQKLVALVALLVILAAACSSGSSPTVTPLGSTSPPGSSATTPTTAAPALSDAELQAMLLTVSDLPTGWAVDNSQDNSNTGEPSCMQQADGGDLAASVQAQFTQAGGVPGLFEALGSNGPGTGKSELAAARQVFDGCTDVSFTSDGDTIHGTIGAMSFPTIGDESAAYAMTFTFQGIQLGFPIVLARKGDVLMMVGVADVGAANVPLLQEMATKAMAKVTGPTA